MLHITYSSESHALGLSDQKGTEQIHLISIMNQYIRDKTIEAIVLMEVYVLK